jgi:PII-like signaling protein
MADEVTIVRIYLHEADHARHETLMQEVLNLLYDQHCLDSLSVFRAIAGFGNGGEIMQADLLRLSVDLPLVIEFFAAAQVIETVLPLLDKVIPSGHILTMPATRRKRPATTTPGT